MFDNPRYRLDGLPALRELIDGNPWAIVVSSTPDGVLASHYPVLREDDPDDPDRIVLLSHFGRADALAHGLGEREVLVIIQGPHGYISPGWYPEGQVVPTWNYVNAHLWGVPELLGPEENLRALGELVDHFELAMPEPRSLKLAPEDAERQSRGTLGFRLRVERYEAKAKLSQNKPESWRERITAELDGDGPYANPALAEQMRRHGSAV